jgi:hypothetical protein
LFIGHQGVAFAAKRAAPEVSLGALFLATMWLDLVWPVFLLLGVETVEIKPGITKVTPFDFISYPWSHSLLFAGLWGVAFGTVYWLFKRDGRGALVLGLVVTSHWVLDLIVHRPDLPLYPGSVRLGLDLWDSLAATLAAEFFVFAGGLWIYLRTTIAKDLVGRFALAGLVAFLVLLYLAVLFGPYPTDWHGVAYSSFLGSLLPLWAWRTDRHRALRT